MGKHWRDLQSDDVDGPSWAPLLVGLFAVFAFGAVIVLLILSRT